MVLTGPEALRPYCYRHRPLLADLLQCGGALLRDALAWVQKQRLEAGAVVVLETAGRSSRWNPHLHILLTSGGVTPQQRWVDIHYFPFEVLQKTWQYYLFRMLKERVRSTEMRQLLDVCGGSTPTAWSPIGIKGRCQREEQGSPST